MTAALREVAELIRSETGIVTRDNQLGGLRAALGRIEPGMDARGFLSEVSDPETGGQLLGLLVDEVTVQETYFFREERALRGIDWAALLRESLERGAGSRAGVGPCLRDRRGGVHARNARG
jgi:hypothetical protein